MLYALPTRLVAVRWRCSIVQKLDLADRAKYVDQGYPVTRWAPKDLHQVLSSGVPRPFVNDL